MKVSQLNFHRTRTNAIKMILQYTFFLAFYGSIVCQNLNTGEHSSNNNNIGQRKNGMQIREGKNKQLPFHVYIIHSNENAYSSEGDRIEPMEDTIKILTVNSKISEEKKENTRKSAINRLDGNWMKYVAKNSNMPAGTLNRRIPIRMKIPRNINGDSFHYKDWHKPGYDVDANSWVPIHRNHLTDSSNTKNHQTNQPFANALTGI